MLYEEIKTEEITRKKARHMAIKHMGRRSEMFYKTNLLHILIRIYYLYSILHSEALNLVLEQSSFCRIR